MKLREFLQQQGISRRKITAMIDASLVSVNGNPIQSYAQELSSGDEVLFDAQKFRYMVSDVSSPKLLLFYKPLGYVCSKSDIHNKTIYELLPAQYKHWYYLGRLDKDSRGLILLTNDAKLVDHYEHPRYGITKEYLVSLNKPFRKEDAKRCLLGIQDENDLLKCVECGLLNTLLFDQYKSYLSSVFSTKPSFVIKIVLNEGRKRHIRRMLSSLGYHVEDLIRIREGDFLLGTMKEGDFCEVSV